MAALVATGRAGTKLFHSYLDGHDQILVIPGYPLLYLYPHLDEWFRRWKRELSWKKLIDAFCEKHASVIDSRRVPGLLGLDRLGPGRDQHIEIDETLFRNALWKLLDGLPIKRRTFLLAVHYAYAICKGWRLDTKRVLLYHVHYAYYLKPLAEDFPKLDVLVMTRDPFFSLGSTFRSVGIFDREKLNPTDALIHKGRTFRLSVHCQFDFLDPIMKYAPAGRVASVRLESLHADVGSTMRKVANWLGVDFEDSMRRSTFDGKAWGGDVTNEQAVFGPDARAMSGTATRFLDSLDSFVMEGVTASLYRSYEYRASVYRVDSLWARVLWIGLSLLPTKAERQIFCFYLDPRTHVHFLRTAWAEGRGLIPLKDYSWNATYRYKWTYQDLKLWRAGWRRALSSFSGRLLRDYPESLIAHFAVALNAGLYVACVYVHFWTAFFFYPTEILKRWGIYMRWWLKRIKGQFVLPKLLV